MASFMVMNATMSEEFASKFAAEWISAWNRRDLDTLLKHYADDVEFTSPFVQRILGNESSTLKGIDAVREYFSRALAAYPRLHFGLFGVYSGARSIVVQYRSVAGLLAAESMEFNETRKVCRVHAHYSVEPGALFGSRATFSEARAGSAPAPDASGIAGG
jgi:hypothetical protein